MLRKSFSFSWAETDGDVNAKGHKENSQESEHMYVAM